MALHDDLLAWVGRQSMAVRGGSAPVLQQTVNGTGWSTLVLGGAANATTIIEARYPKPTPVIVAWNGWFVGAPPFARVPLPSFGYPVNFAAPTIISGETDFITLGVIEWQLGGFRSWAFVDLAGGALSLPGVEWVRFAYYSAIDLALIAPATPTANACIIPSSQRATATVTSQGASIGPGTLPACTMIGSQPFQKSVRLVAAPGVAGEELELLSGDLFAIEDGLNFAQLGTTTIAAINAQRIPIPASRFVFGGGFTSPPTANRDVHLQFEVAC